MHATGYSGPTPLLPVGTGASCSVDTAVFDAINIIKLDTLLLKEPGRATLQEVSSLVSEEHYLQKTLDDFSTKDTTVYYITDASESRDPITFDS